MGDLAICIGPDFRAGTLVVSFRIAGVEVLIGLIGGLCRRSGINLAAASSPCPSVNSWRARSSVASVVAGAGVKRSFVYGKSDKTASAPIENPVHPTQLLATVYHSIGLKPRMKIYNHLKQPREMVKADAITGILS